MHVCLCNPVDRPCWRTALAALILTEQNPCIAMSARMNRTDTGELIIPSTPEYAPRPVMVNMDTVRETEKITFRVSPNRSDICHFT